MRWIALAVLLVAGRAAADPEVVHLAATEGPFDTAFDARCKSLGDAECKRIAAGHAAPFEHIELHEIGGQAYVSLEHGGRWFVGPSVAVMGVGDPTTTQRIDVASVRFATVAMPELGTLAVIRVGLRVAIATHCSRHAEGCTPEEARPRVFERYRDDAFVVCGIVDGQPRCAPPIVVPAELVRREPFTGASLVLSPACRGFDWRAHHRDHDHAVPSPCRYDIAADRAP